MKHATVLVLLLVAAFSFLLALPASGRERRVEWPSHLRLLTGPNEGQWNRLGEKIALVLTDKVIPTSARVGGGMSNISGIGTRKADLGFTLRCLLRVSEGGMPAAFQTENVSLMMNIYPQVIYFLVRKDFADKHGIKSVSDFLRLEQQVSFGSLKPGSASEFLLSLLLKHGYGTNFDELKKQGWRIRFSNYAETADKFVAGELDCFAYTAGTHAPLITILEEYTGVVVLAVDEEVLSRMADLFSTGVFTIMPGGYSGVTTPIRTMGDYACLIVRKDLPDDLVYFITRALWEHKKYLAGFVDEFGELSPVTALPPSEKLAHPGAESFWEELNADK